MKCPYCQQEMEPGMIQSGRQIFFSKKRKKLLILANSNEGDVVIGPMDWLYSSYAFAHHCENCRKVVIDLAAER
jgi:hypothetical protein